MQLLCFSFCFYVYTTVNFNVKFGYMPPYPVKAKEQRSRRFPIATSNQKPIFILIGPSSTFTTGRPLNTLLQYSNIDTASPLT